MKNAKPVPAFAAGFIAVAVFFLFSAAAISAAVAAGATEPPPESRTERQIEGWSVRVDDRLLQPPNVEFGQRVLKFLEAKLSDITYVVSPERLTKLRAVPIVLDLSHGQLQTMQYHPNAGWLAEHGYATNLVKCVHIPRAADLVTARNVNEQPWVILHELAHAYHDQVLGFDDPRILQAYERYRQRGHGEATLLFDGSRVRHYALTDHKEFFAEMTEAYFGENDFFPFNRAELMTAEPEIYELLQAIWGPVAGRLDKPPKPGKTSSFQKTSPAEATTGLGPDQPVTMRRNALPTVNDRWKS